VAKVKGPLFSIVAMGTIDNDLTYRKRKGIDDVKKYIKTVNPDTPGQQTQKGFFKNAIDAWSIDGYSEADKIAWNQFAKTKKVITSGFNRFTSSKIMAEKEGSTWNKLTNCTIYDVTAAGFKVDIDVNSDLSGILYIGVSKYSMLREIVGVFSVNKYTFTVADLQDENKYYFYIKNTSVGEGARTGIYSQYHVGGFVPSPIDVGNPAINRNDFIPKNNTVIDKNVSADGSGKIKTIETYFLGNMTNVKVGIFYVVSGNFLTTRSNVTLGPVTGNSKQIITKDSGGNDISLDVVAGDYIGVYFTAASGGIENTWLGGATWYLGGDKIPCTNQEFSFDATHYKTSIHGIGETIA